VISRDQILELLVRQFKEKFGYEIDFDNPTLETWLVETLSILDENQLMYLTLLMNESFLSTALLPSTIKKFATDYGYAYKFVQPAHGKVDLYIKLDQSNIDSVIDYTTEFVSTTGVTYIPKFKVYISFNHMTGVANITAYDLPGNKYVLPYTIEYIKDGNQSFQALHFSLDVIQAKRETYSFVVNPKDVTDFKFPTFSIPKQSDSLSDINVYVGGQLAERKRFLFELDKQVYSYVLLETPSEFKIIFGNSLIGKALNPGEIVIAEAFFSKGSKGNVYANTLSLKSTITNKVTQQPLYIVVKHKDILNGRDAESPNEIRLNTIKSLHMNKRLVSRKDYEFYFKDKTEFVDVFTVFTESDLYVNEILVYGFLSESSNLLPSFTGVIKTTTENIKQFTKVYQNDLTSNELDLTKTSDNALEFTIPFEIKINTDIMLPIIYYYPQKNQITFRIIQENYYSLDRQSFVKVNSIHLIYNKEKQKSEIVVDANLYVTELLEPYSSNLKATLKLSQNNEQKTYEANNILVDKSSNKVTFVFELDNENYDDSLIDGSLQIEYKFQTKSDYETISYISLSPFFMKYNITTFTPVKMTYKHKSESIIEYTLYGVPVINLDTTEDPIVDSLYLSTVEDLDNYKMITTKVALGFGKTHGLLTTLDITQSKLNTAPSNKIPIPLRLYCKVYVSTNLTYIDIKKDVTKVINDYLKPGFNKSFIISQAIRQIEDQLDYVKKVELFVYDKDGNKTTYDIDIKIDSRHIPKNKLLEFVPEILSLGDIDLDVVYL